MENIKNYEKYNSGMKKSIKDKLFFEGLVDNTIDTFVDFGCADGQILKQVHEDFPEWNLRGIDCDEKMRALAEKNCPEAVFDGGIGNSYWLDNSTSILNMSSVIHEIYSYVPQNEIDQLWEDIFDCHFKYISIRDLMLSNTAHKKTSIQDIHKLYRNGIMNADDPYLINFEKKWGSVQLNENLLHYLMKYRYIENWEREVKENYFPITVEDLIGLIPSSYEIVYFNHYVLPFTRDRVMKDFGIEIKDNTHVKILLKRRDL